jgi:hypothetical protein
MPRPGVSDRSKDNSAERLLASMRQRFPVMADFRPLISGIQDELGRHYPDVPNWRIIAALRRHVHDVRYLQAILGCEQRHNLLGDPAGEVTAGERAFARERLSQYGGAAEGADLATDPLADIKHGQRLLLGKLVAARFGEDTAQASRALLNQLDHEDPLAAVGIALLDCPDGDSWLQLLRERVPAPVAGAVPRA